MSQAGSQKRLRVLIAGGGIAAMETALALADLAGELTSVSVLAPNSELVNRPMTVREPFAYPQARRYPLAEIVSEAGAELLTDTLAWVDPVKRVAHTDSGAEIEYDALVLALGARASVRYKHALTIDDRRLDETLHGLIQDLEGGYISTLAFVAPGRMAWPLPLYEIAMMTAGRAWDMGIDVTTTLITPEDRPLGIFGTAASEAVAGCLKRARIQAVTSSYAEVPHTGEVVINPGDHHLKVDRVIALPELYGPCLRGIPLSEHGFIRVGPHGEVLDVERVYAAGDATEFPIKHGGVGSQQADAVAESIAALAGAPLEPQPFHPVIHGMLLTDAEPVYLTARITGGQGFSSEVTDGPTWSPPGKLATRYLSPYLDRHDREHSGAAS
jgi:sulfide:quinone oxidoreductase